jgi:hypothetical protein
MVGEVTVLLCCTKQGEARGKNRTPSSYQQRKTVPTLARSPLPGPSKIPSMHCWYSPAKLPLCEPAGMKCKPGPTFWGPRKFVANGFEREGLS